MYKPKKYWCPHLSQLRDKKKFWWSLWNDNGRPKQGQVYDCYKGTKKLFRKYCRYYMQNEVNSSFINLNSMYRERKMSCFWNGIKRLKRKRVNSSLQAQAFSDYYATVMQDNHDALSLTDSQQFVIDTVQRKFKESDGELSSPQITEITAEMVSKMIDGLNKSSSPGCDGVTAEHLLYGKSHVLCDRLATFYTYILKQCIIPSVFTTGIIIPILKKSSLNPNLPENFRPITLSSVHSKLIESFMVPADQVSDVQFGFREKRSTSFACTLLHDIGLYFNSKGSPVYVCALDAEKCFDRVWHDGLFFKLLDVLPSPHWRFLYKWYRSTVAVVRWNGDVSPSFSVSRGVRQGSILSPHLFNIFINDMLNDVSTSGNGVRIGDEQYNVCAYADDVTLLSSTITGLQRNINICADYAKAWRFNFNPKKSNCLTMGPNLFSVTPCWYLGNTKLLVCDEIDILGVQFTNSSAGSSRLHVDKRLQLCRQSYYGLGNIGLSYPGLGTDVKTHLWKTICTPVLTYGLETINLPKDCINKIESAQGTLVKRFLGIGKRSHHSTLLKALYVPHVTETVTSKTISLFRRFFRVDSPLSTLYSYMLANYILHGSVTKGSILDRIIRLGLSPMQLISDASPGVLRSRPHEDGVVDSLRYLTAHENFIKPWSEEHVLSVLLTRCF